MCHQHLAGSCKCLHHLPSSALGSMPARHIQSPNHLHLQSSKMQDLEHGWCNLQSSHLQGWPNFVTRSQLSYETVSCKYSNDPMFQCSNVQMFKLKSQMSNITCQMSNVSKVKLLSERTSRVPPVFLDAIASPSSYPC